MTPHNRPFLLVVLSLGLAGIAACELPQRVQYFAPCADTADCGAGYVCSADSVCLPESGGPELDSGTLDAGGDPDDAGVDVDGGADAGALDAGALDAGALDAGALDAGALDAGDFDAGVFDAGVFDAGVLDAGVVDAGVVDAGVVDAGVVDAGVVDAGPPPGPWSFIDDVGTFPLGTLQRLHVGVGLELDANDNQGIYMSPVFSADNPSAVAESFSFTTVRPAGRPLPAGVASAIEQGSHASGGADLTDIVMLLQFDELPRALTIGESIVDSSPQNTDVVLVDNPPLSNSRIEDGKVGGGIFIAFEDYLDIRSATIDPAWAFSPESTTGDFTYSVWMKADSCDTAGENNLIALGGEDPHIWIGIDCPTGNPTIRVIDEFSGVDATGIVSTDDGQWHHLVGLRRSATSQVELYVDGILAASAVMVPNLLRLFTVGVFLGNFPIGSPPLWTYRSAVSLDEVAVFRRALTLQEIFALYTRGATSVTAQVRGCPTNICSGVSFVGPDGTSTTSFAADFDATVGPHVPFALGQLGPHFQYRLGLSRDRLGLPLAVDVVRLDAAVPD